MSQWMTLFGKEMMEMKRNAKWLWVPLVFLALGIMQPVTTYYMAQILENMGGLPEGTVIEMPVPAPEQVLVQTLSQFSSVGVLIIVLASMTVVSGERASGVAGMIMLKPVPHVSYITAKWAGLLSLTFVSFAAGYGGAWYYTNLLFGYVDMGRVGLSFLVYGLWLAFIVTLTVLLSSSLKGSGGIAFMAIAAAMGLSIAGGLFAKYMRWSPSKLADHAGLLLTQGKGGAGFALCLIVSFALIAALIVCSVRIFKSKSLFA
ncbi:ABC transporter permease [Paenibacillus contaminans]|uniref:ABC transporter permease n=1 Tax=Paenibacillus contaminans TaxID=450362 RepID=A0A329MC51_9BACL|nr:ABC transporter permease [Paenibacillus contaminans]RAV17675.1 ABC transporter permease [Paenibacillus contaminans]